LHLSNSAAAELLPPGPLLLTLILIVVFEALARATALDPVILFGDEPSAGLDPVTASALDQLLFKLRDTLNMTLVLVTHELASIQRIADRIIFLDEGRILYQGDLPGAKTSSIPVVEQFFNP